MPDTPRQIIASYIQQLSATLRQLSLDEVAAVTELLRAARAAGRSVYIMGNGGSASNASHIQSDLNKGKGNDGAGTASPRMKSVALNDNIPTMLAVANDHGYENVFVEQLRNYLEEGDIVMVISGSGNSKNVVKAVELANQRGAVTVALVGFDGGVLKRTARYVVHVPVNDMQISEDIHLAVGHMLMRSL